LRGGEQWWGRGKGEISLERKIKSTSQGALLGEIVEGDTNCGMLTHMRSLSKGAKANLLIKETKAFKQGKSAMTIKGMYGFDSLPTHCISGMGRKNGKNNPGGKGVRKGFWVRKKADGEKFVENWRSGEIGGTYLLRVTG